VTLWCVAGALALGPSASAGTAPAPTEETRPDPQRTVKRRYHKAEARRVAPAGGPRLRQVDADGRGGRRWVRWVVVGAGVAAAGAATYAVLSRNHPPTPGTIGVSPGERGMANATTFAFASVGASDADGDTLRYSWNLGDGARAEGAQVSHVYSSVGTYTISLEVSDGGPPLAAPPTTVTVERNLTGTWSGGHALPMMNPLRLELTHDARGLSGTLVAEPYRGTAGGASRIEGRVESATYPCRLSWSTVLLGAVTLRFEGGVASAESDVMTGTISVDQPGQFSHTGQTTFRR
jgi:hypothetical protein